MKRTRLAVLLAVMLGLAALRWWSPPGERRDPVVAAVSPAVQRAAVVQPHAQAPADWAAGTRDADGTKPGNAFAVRMPPAPPPPPKPPPPATPKPFIGPPPPPPVVAAAPPPPPPLQVIGSWQDEQGPSVFIAGPRGLMQGRVGDVLMGEYRITRISPQQVLVTDVQTQRETPLPVPSGTLPPLTAAR